LCVESPTCPVASVLSYSPLVRVPPGTIVAGDGATFSLQLAASLSCGDVVADVLECHSCPTMRAEAMA
jgi:hypothetical protein